MIRALVVRQPWANQIVTGEKKIEYRSWSTEHRGPLVIIAGRRKHPDCRGPYGVTVALVELVDVVEGEECYEWMLGKVLKLGPHEIRGQLGLFEISTKNLLAWPPEDHQIKRPDGSRRRVRYVSELRKAFHDAVAEMTR